MSQLPTTEPAWEDVGVQRLIAIVVTALHTPASAHPMKLDHLVWHLAQGPAHVRQLAARLVGQDLATAIDIDPASVNVEEQGMAAWVWLTRTWPEGGPWDGMPRGLAPGLTDPAVEILTAHATHAAIDCLTHERGGHERGTLVTALDGRYEGHVATVMTSVWRADNERETVIGPPAYEVLFRAPDATGHQREVLPADQLRPATREEQALERAQSMGVEIRFGSVWQACERWAVTLVWSHRQQAPERWLTDADPHGRGPVVTGLLAAALYSTVCARQLDEPSDGSRVLMAPLAPVADTFAAGWHRVVEILEGLPAEDSPTLGMLRALRKASGVTGDEHQAVLDLAYDVAWEHTRSATVPADTTIADLATGLAEPRLVDLLDAIAAATHRQRELDLDWPQEL